MNRISVIVPVYNAEQFLRRCIDSILNQSLVPAEVILVDDGSTDQSGVICDEYAQRQPTVFRVFHQKNSGPGSARNCGIEHAKGDFLFFIDSDDYLEPNAFEELMNVKEHAEIVCGEMLIENPDGSTYCQASKQVSFHWTSEDALVELCSYRYLRFSCCATLYSRNLFETIRFPNTICEDYSIQYQLVAEAKETAYTSLPVYRYYQRPLSRSRSTVVSLAPIEVSDAQLAFFRANFPRIAWAAESDCVFARMGIYTSYIRMGQDCSPNLLKGLQIACKPYLKSVWKHDRLPQIKKLQAFVFCFFPYIYRFVIARTEHR